jgi:hypothetical protein
MQYAVTGPNIPYGTRQLINKLLADPRASAFLILITADHLDAMAAELPPSSHYIEPFQATARELREIAPQYPWHPIGKPHGDFDGTLSV